jgi:antitoxin (DNA-binding transcriptional repressor) of toxin-antitoxin stability system
VLPEGLGARGSAECWELSTEGGEEASFVLVTGQSGCPEVLRTEDWVMGNGGCSRFIDKRCTRLYIEVIMKLSISEARKRLPALVRRVRRDATTSIEITVHNEVVAELRAVQPGLEPGAAARRLLRLMKKLPRPRGRKTPISSHVETHLYGPRGAIR